MSSGEMKEIKTSKGIIPKEDDLIESPIKMQEEDDWNQYSDEDHDFTLVQMESQKRNNSIVYESNKPSTHKNIPPNNFSFVNKNENYNKSYKKPFNEKKYTRTNDYHDRYDHSGKSTFSNKNYDKKNFKSDKYNYKDNNKHINYDEGKKNYCQENLHYSEEIDKTNWKKGGQNQTQNWNDEYHDVNSYNDNYEKFDKESKRKYSENYDYKKKSTNYNKPSGFTQNKNFNDPNYNDNFNDNINNNNKYYSKKQKPYDSHKNTFTEKHFSSNDYPVEKSKHLISAEKAFDINLNQKERFSNEQTIEIIPCDKAERNYQKNNNKTANNSEIHFFEKKTFTNSNLINSSINSASPKKTTESSSVNNCVPNTTNNVTNFPQSSNSNSSFKVKSTPPQNKFNNPDVNISPLINRNLPNNPNVQNLTSLEESAREKALNLNSASYYPSKWKDKNAESNFNKYDMNSCVSPPQQQNVYTDNIQNYQYPTYNEYPKQTQYFQQNMPHNPIQTSYPTQYQYQYPVNPQMMQQQPMMYQPIVQPARNYASSVMHPITISNNPNVYFNNFGLLNK